MRQPIFVLLTACSNTWPYYQYGVSGNSADWRANTIYDISGWLLAQCINTSGTCGEGVPNGISNQPLDQRYRFNIYGNLKTQWHARAWGGTGTARGKETYQYDALHRLTQASRTSADNATTTTYYGYNAIGCLFLPNRSPIPAEAGQ